MLNVVFLKLFLLLFYAHKKFIFSIKPPHPACAMHARKAAF